MDLHELPMPPVAAHSNHDPRSEHYRVDLTFTLSSLGSCLARGNARRISSRCSATGKNFIAVGAVSFPLFLVVLKPGTGQAKT